MHPGQMRISGGITNMKFIVEKEIFERLPDACFNCEAAAGLIDAENPSMEL